MSIQEWPSRLPFQMKNGFCINWKDDFLTWPCQNFDSLHWKPHSHPGHSFHLWHRLTHWNYSKEKGLSIFFNIYILYSVEKPIEQFDQRDRACAFNLTVLCDAISGWIPCKRNESITSLYFCSSVALWNSTCTIFWMIFGTGWLIYWKVEFLFGRYIRKFFYGPQLSLVQ